MFLNPVTAAQIRAYFDLCRKGNFQATAANVIKGIPTIWRAERKYSHSSANGTSRDYDSELSMVKVVIKVLEEPSVVCYENSQALENAIWMSNVRTDIEFYVVYLGRKKDDRVFFAMRLPSKRQAMLFKLTHDSQDRSDEEVREIIKGI